jgi:hypothetical protein
LRAIFQIVEMDLSVQLEELIRQLRAADGVIKADILAG